jgi:superfamily II DNA or RNA helicase
MIYPLPSNPDFNKNINEIFRKYEIPKTPKTFNEICFPKKYTLQIPQQFLAEFMNPNTPYKGLLVYHKIGGGKTCVAISIAEKFIGKKNIIVVVPASLKGNFRTELRTPCTGEKYLSNKERDIIKKLQPTDKKYIDIIEKSDDIINQNYNIYSYNKFVDFLRIGKIDLTNSLLIIDEIQNMVSETGVYYHVLYNTIKQAPYDLRLVLLTATPIFDKPIELALTMNLLIHDEFPIGNDFNESFIKKNGNDYEVINMNIFKEKIKGYVSYYQGAPEYVFPRTELYFVNCPMSEPQLELYNIIAKHEYTSGDFSLLNDNISNNFYIGTRMTSNFMYPYGQEYDTLSDSDFELDVLSSLSRKYYKIIKKIKKCHGIIFIYSNFKQYGGLASLIRALKVNGYRDYANSGIGKNTFAVWSGDQKMKYREKIKEIFNNKNNEDGSKIKIILGSSAIKEGVTLLRVQQVHIIEPYWNWSRLDQVMGRANRYCSHKDVVKEKQLVKIYIYFAVHNSLRMSVDQKIMDIALRKKSINIKFERALKEAAIDCTLFRYANVDKNDSPIICDK